MSRRRMRYVLAVSVSACLVPACSKQEQASATGELPAVAKPIPSVAAPAGGENTPTATAQAEPKAAAASPQAASPAAAVPHPSAAAVPAAKAGSKAPAPIVGAEPTPAASVAVVQPLSTEAGATAAAPSGKTFVPMKPATKISLAGPKNDEITIVSGRTFPAATQVNGQMAVDGNDNVYIAVNHSQVMKLGSDLKVQWTKPAPDVKALAGAPDEGVFAVGGNGDATLLKLAGDGSTVFSHSIGAGGIEKGQALFVAKDGSSTVLGTSSGQLPGQPATVSGGNFLAKFDASGKSTSTKQATPYVRAGVSMANGFLDANGSAYDFGLGLFVKLSPEGDLIFHKATPGLAMQLVSSGAMGGGSVLFAADGQQVCGVDTREGEMTWCGQISTPSAVIEPVEGVEWHSLTSVRAVAASSRALFVAGTTVNSYNNGSTPRPQQSGMFVARYSHDGKVVWARQYAIESLNQHMQPVVPERIALSLDTKGNLLVSGGGLAPTESSGKREMARAAVVIRLNAGDGKLM